MYNSIEYSDICSKTAVSLWQCYRDEPTLDHNNNIIDSPADSNNNILFSLNKNKIKGQAENIGTKVIEIMFPLKHLSNFWRKLEISLINCEISLMLTWSLVLQLIKGRHLR